MGLGINGGQIHTIANQIDKQDDNTKIGLSESGELVTASGSRKVKKADTERLRGVLETLSIVRQGKGEKSAFIPKKITERTITAKQAKAILSDSKIKTNLSKLKDNSPFNKLFSNKDQPQNISKSKILPDSVKRILKQLDNIVGKKTRFDQILDKSKELAKDTFSSDEIKQIGSRYSGNIKIPKHSAIQLRSSGNNNSRFIHANLHSDGKTITTQHVRNDKSHHLPDFFEAVFDNDVSMIKNLTNMSTASPRGDRYSKKNSSRPAFDYWPPRGQSETHGAFTVTTNNIEKKDGYSIISITVKEGNQSKATKIFHFENWPDHGVPTEKSLEQYKDYLSACDAHTKRMGSSDKTMIHCHAGVGRTGSQVILDKMKRDIDSGRTTVENFEQHLYENLWELRQNGGSNMVQESGQLDFVRDFTLNYLQQKTTQPDTNFDDHTYGNIGQHNQPITVQDDTYANFTPAGTPQGSPKTGVRTKAAKQEALPQQAYTPHASPRPNAAAKPEIPKKPDAATQQPKEENPYMNGNWQRNPEGQNVSSPAPSGRSRARPTTMVPPDARSLFEALPQKIQYIAGDFISFNISEQKLLNKISDLSTEELMQLGAWANQAKIEYTGDDKELAEKIVIHVNEHLKNSNRPGSIATNHRPRPNNPIKG